MTLETLILGSLASYGVNRKAKDLKNKYSEFYTNNYPYYGDVNLKRVITTFKGIGLFYTVVTTKVISIGLLYYVLLDILNN